MALLNRLFGHEVGGKRNILVMNDEAHHAYRIHKQEAEEEDDLFGDDRRKSKRKKSSSAKRRYGLRGWTASTRFAASTSVWTCPQRHTSWGESGDKRVNRSRGS